MDILLVSCNAKYIHMAPAIYAIASGIETYARHIHKTTLIDTTIHKDKDLLLEEIAKTNPQIIGFSTYIWNVEFILSLLPPLKKMVPKVQIFLGGPEVAFRPHSLLNDYQEIDYVLAGEGERQVAKLLDNLEEKLPLSAVVGCYFRGKKDAEEPCEKSAHCEDALSGVLSETDSTLPPVLVTERYLQAVNGRIVYYEASRGCPFSCTFCLSGQKGNYRSFPLSRVFADLACLVKSGTQTIKFIDRTFNARPSFARAIFSWIIEHEGTFPPSLCFHFEINAELLTEECFALLAQIKKGRVQFEIGLQTYTGEVLTAISRHMQVERFETAIAKLLALNNIHIHIDLIAGLPYETDATFRESFRKAYQLGTHMLQLGFLKMLHGSPMQGNYLADFSDKPPYEVIGTPTMTKEELICWHVLEDGLERYANSGVYPQTLQLCSLKQPDPYLLFFALGEKIHALPKVTHYQVIENLYHVALSLGVPKEILRDSLIFDLYTHNNSGFLPDFLRVEDSELAIFIKKLKKIAPQKPCVRRSVAVLYTKGKILMVDYTEKEKITLEYPYTLWDIASLSDKEDGQ